MVKIKCHICKAKNKGTVCTRCGANLGAPITEQLVLSTSGYTWFTDNKKYVNHFSSCKVSFTSERLVIYKIRPDANNPAFGLLKDVVNAIVKNPCICIDFNEIEWVRRYGEKYVISTDINEYCVWLKKDNKLDELFAPYKQTDGL